MPRVVKKPRIYSPEKFGSFDLAYGKYVLDRMKDRVKPTLAPRKKFRSAWGWDKIARPGK